MPNRLVQWANTPLFNEPQDAPRGGGFRGAASRFGRGFQQGIMPTRGQVITRGLNPLAYLAGGLAEGLGDVFRGFGGERGSPLPGWMMGGAPMPTQNPYAPNWPGAGTWPSQGQENPYYGQGQGMMRGPQGIPQNPYRYQGNRGGTRGTVIAEGPAAQQMFEGMREGARSQQLDDAQRRFRDRMMSMYQ